MLGKKRDKVIPPYTSTKARNNRLQIMKPFLMSLSHQKLKVYVYGLNSSYYPDSESKLYNEVCTCSSDKDISSQLHGAG